MWLLNSLFMELVENLSVHTSLDQYSVLLKSVFFPSVGVQKHAALFHQCGVLSSLCGRT